MWKLLSPPDAHAGTRPLAARLANTAFQTLLVALGLALTFEIIEGAGRHAIELSASQLRLFNLTDVVGSTIAIVVTALAKTGFAVTLLTAAEGSTRFLVWLTLAVVNAVSGVAGMLLWLQCTPLRMNFEPVPRGSCFPSQVRVGIQIMNTCECWML